MKKKVFHSPYITLRNIAMCTVQYYSPINIHHLCDTQRFVSTLLKQISRNVYLELFRTL